MKILFILLLSVFSFNCFADKKILFVGDSITLSGYPNKLMKKIEDYEYCVIAKNGTSSDTIVKEIRNGLKEKYDIVIVFIGTNDCFKNNGKNFNLSVSRIAGMLGEFSENVFFVKLYLNGKCFNYLNNEMKQKFGSFFIDYDQRLLNTHLKDKVHLNKKGEGILADIIWRFISELCRL